VNEAIESVCVPVMTNDPACVPGWFTVRMDEQVPDHVMRELEHEFAVFGGASEAISEFLTWMHFVEQEARSFPQLLDGVALLKGAVMAVGASMVGTW
jgi:hypothetical protein